MGQGKPREERRSVFLPARLRAGHGWRDATIADVSSRGLMLRCPSPPGRSTIVEVRHRGTTIVGRVVWTNGNRAGVRTQDPIDIVALLSLGPVSTRKAGEDRRTAPRGPVAGPRPTIAASQAEASQRFRHVFEWSIVAAAGIAAAGCIAGSAGALLREPLTRAGVALDPAAPASQPEPGR